MLALPNAAEHRSEFENILGENTWCIRFGETIQQYCRGQERSGDNKAGIAKV